jgi:hypothetical protein
MRPFRLGLGVLLLPALILTVAGGIVVVPRDTHLMMYSAAAVSGSIH